MAKKVLLGLHTDYIMEICADIYSEKGCEVCRATNMADMMTYMMNEQYDVYIMDANLGSSGGDIISPAETVFALLKERILTRQAKFLAISGKDRVVKRAEEAGIPAKAKPISLDLLLELIT